MNSVNAKKHNENKYSSAEGMCYNVLATGGFVTHTLNHSV